MQVTKPVGRNGAARKYDLLSVLGAHALARGKADQRLVLRLICLITARYNWQTDELTVGQTEMARLWSVDLRTVKREMAALRARGWLVEKRPAARGRVAVHGLGMARILADTAEDWGRVGPDLAARLQEGEPPVMPPQTNVVPFPVSDDPTLWGRACRMLQGQNATTFAAWIAGLQMDCVAGGEVRLRAPSAFHASYVSTHLGADLLTVLRRLDPGVVSVRVL